MFYKTKKENSQKQETINKEQDDFMVSNYAMERYKKSEHYKKVDDLTNEEIELLFCNKKDWNGQNRINLFKNALEKITSTDQGAFSNIVFPNYTQIFKKRGIFEDCTFYGGSIEGNEVFFENCDFFKTDDSPFRISIEGILEFDKINDYVGISIFSCNELNIYNSEIRFLYISHAFKLKKINTIRIFRSKFKKGIRLSNNAISKLVMKDLIFDRNSEFSIFTNHIKKLEIYNLDLSEINTGYSVLKVRIKNLHIESTNLPMFFNLEKTNKCFIKESVIKEFKDVKNKRLSLAIVKTSLSSGEYYVLLEAENINIFRSKLDKLSIKNTPNLLLSNNTIQNLSLLDNINDILISNTTIEDCDFNYLKNKDICILERNAFQKADFRFASINKLAIYKSSFNELDFDCSFINEARFSHVKGLNEENKEEELSDKHFVSNESFNYFKTNSQKGGK